MQSENEEMIDIQDNPSVQQSIMDVAMISRLSGRSRKGALPVLWTRILNPDQDLEEEIKSFELDMDKLFKIDDELDS